MNKKMVKLVLGMVVMITVVGKQNVLNTNAATLVTEENTTEQQMETRASRYTWILKEINGKMYRRLYDTTDNVWIGDWILCE